MLLYIATKGVILVILVTERLIRSKIDEYLNWISKTRLVTDQKLLDKYSRMLNNLQIKRIYDAPGDAQIGYESLYYCAENIEQQMVYHGLYYLDEVFFHEFSHLINSFHNALAGPNRFIIRDAISNKMDEFTTPELLEESDRLLFNQDPWLGVILLDEYIAQSVAQEIVKGKNSELDFFDKEMYSFNGLKEFNLINYTTRVCEPPITIPTTLADYPEFDICAQRFISKYLHISPSEFIKKSLNEDLLRNIINNLDTNTAGEIYIDLCYLGLIKEAVSISKGHKQADRPDDPVNDKRNVNMAFQRILIK